MESIAHPPNMRSQVHGYTPYGLPTLNSLSGGKSSAYMSVHYPADHEVFSIVCLDSKELTPKDPGLVKYANTKLEQSGFLSMYGEFVATPEFDSIIKTMMELEQLIGRNIVWVRGLSYEQTVGSKGGWLPNKLHRYCTYWTKIVPIFEYWLMRIGTPIEERIGFRATEKKRVSKNRKTKYLKTVQYNPQMGIKSQRNKWKDYCYSSMSFPLYFDKVHPETIHSFWNTKPVTFSDLNNCGGCFNRHPVLLAYIYHKYEEQKAKFDYFWIEQENYNRKKYNKKTQWRSDVAYEDIVKLVPQQEDLFGNLSEKFSGCETGSCGI